MTHLLKECARTLSQRERVAAEQPGEGLRTPQVIHASRVCACSPKIETPHPPPPAAPSPSGRGWARSFVARKRHPWCARASDIRCAANFFDHPIQPFLHLVIGKAKLDKPVTLDKHAARGVAFELVAMMFAVELDCHAKFVAAEIRDKSCDRHLSAEFQSVKPVAAKLLPKNVFGRSAFKPQTACDLDWPFTHDRQSGHRRLRSQPLTRPRIKSGGRPLPLGEGLGLRQ
jgi:hypothetical protein